jgi:peptidoglycan hydrolase-like protein with peptidoglycan-binding domain
VALAGAALAASPALATAQPLGSRVLYVGMRGADVRTLQRDLTIVGFTTRANGIFNRGTFSHVVAFQRRYRLAADGVVGPMTAAKLEAVVVARQRLGSAASSSGTAQTGAASLGSTSSNTTAKPKSTTTTTTTTTTTPTTGTTTSGGAGMGPDPNDGPVEPVTLDTADGLAVAPADAPPAIVELIAAANRIAHLPYIYGGGHNPYHGNPVALDAGYDCSGSVSFALHGAGLLAEPLDSSQFETWGTPGAGVWITLYTNPGHVYMNVGGLWFDTGAQSTANGNDRWSVTRASPASGFIELHPTDW